MSMGNEANGGSIPGGTYLMPPMDAFPQPSPRKILAGLGAPTPNVPGQPISQRIADVAKRLTEAAYELESVRIEHDDAIERLKHWERRFADAAGELAVLIQEHREEVDGAD